ncbi:hypothetical protein TCAL_07279 [Tigriopus californicus]|uniref:TIR domain-containing protein n=1 Tax=Tigriopus californicus TaxID=6832 RepID=A0A553NBX4_TIGCA|nr:toll-like receptor Tollo [Tigriopus californicus]TRY62943.1 hypothetical protein TCAL_07279 [Tigriopus californicus]
MERKVIAIAVVCFLSVSSLACEYQENGQTIVCHMNSLSDPQPPQNTDFSQAKKIHVKCTDTFFTESQLKSEQFGNLPFLESLDIQFCKLRQVPSRTFSGLTNLRQLTIQSHNSEWSSVLMEVDAHSFQNLEHVQSLDLAHNNIWSMPSEVLCSMSKLLEANFSNNHLLEVSDLGLSSRKGCRTTLNSLDLSNNHIGSIQDGDLIQTPNLTKLSLAGNRISIMGDRSLESLTNLEELNLSDNQLAALPPTIFNRSQSLHRLELQNNSLTLLPSGIFEGLSNLVVLNLSRNAISSHLLSKDTFSGLKNLQVLDLSWNEMTKIEDTTFQHLASLRSLNLQHNNIHIVKSQGFNSLVNLNILALSFNEIEELSSDMMSGLSQLSSLSMEHNKIKSIGMIEPLPSLTDLTLSNNQLKSVPEFISSSAANLKTIDLGDNQIKEINPRDLGGLANLYGLRLAGNQISTISNQTFENVTNIHILNLAHNQISSLEGGAFHRLQNLRALRLDNNRLEDINGLVASLRQLQWLNISSNSLQWFDYAFIPTSLEWLDMSHNSVSELGNFYNLRNFGIRTLQAAHNKIRVLTVDSFPNSLEHIDMNSNELDKIEPFTFGKLEELKMVDLRHNGIQSLYRDSLRSASRHQDQPQFALASNPLKCDCQLAWLGEEVTVVGRDEGSRDDQPQSTAGFGRVSDINELECSVPTRSNQVMPLILVPGSDFLCPYTAHCSAQCMCCDFYACDCRFQCPDGCRCFHDQKWSQNIVQCSGREHHSVPLLVPLDATEVRLDGNNLQHLDTQSFLGRDNVKELYLNGSNIISLGNKTFAGLDNLEVLHLEDNNIGEIMGSEFNSLRNLRELYLHNNDLVFIHEVAFQALMNLVTLTLDGNLLTIFPVWRLYDNPDLRGLTLSRNTWSCECNFIQPFNDFLEKNHRIIPDYDLVQCVSDNIIDENSLGESGILCSQSQGSYLEQNNGSSVPERDSSTLNLATILVPIVVAVCVLVLGFFAIFVFRANIIAWLYNKSSDIYEQRSGASSSSAQSTSSTYSQGKLFDVYISYSMQDTDFVDQTLAPTLEQGSTSYKLCLHQRDFPSNVSLYDTVSVATESSTRVLVVLSRAYLTVDWPQVKIPLRNALKDNGKVIFLTIEDLSESEINSDADLASYYKSFPFIRWGSAGFLQKLKFFLPESAFQTFQRNITLRNQYRQAVTGLTPHHHHNPASTSVTSSSSLIPSLLSPSNLVYGDRKALESLQYHQHPHYQPHHSQQPYQQQHQHAYGRSEGLANGSPTISSLYGENVYQSISDKDHIYQSLEPNKFLLRTLDHSSSPRQISHQQKSALLLNNIIAPRSTVTTPIPNQYFHEHSHSTSSGTQLLSNQGEEYIV